MTRFLTFEESVELVLEAFKNGKNGKYLFITPACTIENLASDIKNYQNKIENKIYRTRHGEKLFETLVSQEELLNLNHTKNF